MGNTVSAPRLRTLLARGNGNVEAAVEAHFSDAEHRLDDDPTARDEDDVVIIGMVA